MTPLFEHVGLGAWAIGPGRVDEVPSLQGIGTKITPPLKNPARAELKVGSAAAGNASLRIVFSADEDVERLAFSIARDEHVGSLVHEAGSWSVIAAGGPVVLVENAPLGAGVWHAVELSITGASYAAVVLDGRSHRPEVISRTVLHEAWTESETFDPRDGIPLGWVADVVNAYDETQRQELGRIIRSGGQLTVSREHPEQVDESVEAAQLLATDNSSPWTTYAIEVAGGSLAVDKVLGS